MTNLFHIVPSVAGVILDYGLNYELMEILNHSNT